MKTLQEALTEATKQVKVPNDIYHFRVVEAKADTSKNGHLQFVLECEIIDHPGIIQGDNTINLNGTKGMKYLTVTDAAVKFLAEFHRSAGLPLDITVAELSNNPNPELYKGREFKALAYSKENVQVNEVTKQPVLHPETGKPITNYNLQIGNCY